MLGMRTHMVNVDKLLGQILNSSQGKTLAGGLLVGGLAGALTGKTGQKMAASALKLGGAAAVAGLAYTAYQRYRASQPQATRGTRLESTIPPTSRSVMTNAGSSLGSVRRTNESADGTAAPLAAAQTANAMATKLAARESDCRAPSVSPYTNTLVRESSCIRSASSRS